MTYENIFQKLTEIVPDSFDILLFILKEFSGQDALELL